MGERKGEKGRKRRRSETNEIGKKGGELGCGLSNLIWPESDWTLGEAAHLLLID
jgi:hypothetical protein